MKPIISCAFNMDTACVELRFLDGTMLAIDTMAVEDKVAANMYERQTQADQPRSHSWPECSATDSESAFLCSESMDASELHGFQIQNCILSGCHAFGARFATVSTSYAEGSTTVCKTLI